MEADIVLLASVEGLLGPILHKMFTKDTSFYLNTTRSDRCAHQSDPCSSECLRRCSVSTQQLHEALEDCVD